MTEVLERMWQVASSSLSQLWNFILTAAARLDPLSWGLIGVGLAILTLLVLLLRRKRPEPQSRPEVLVSLGAISVYEGPDASGAVLLPKRYLLKMTVSNLNPYPMQVLELALKTPEMAMPVTLELAELIPPEGSVVVSETLPEISGEEGRLNLYLYAANNTKRTYRLQASFTLEPWNARYKISPLNQTIAPSKQLASAGVNRVRERAWREQREQERAHVEERRVRAYAEPEERRERTTGAGGFNFPDEF